MHKPYLIDDLKFDLRIYVLLCGVNPLRAYIYKEGMVRFATEPYQSPNSSNLKNMYMHLTNYAINKNHEDYEDGDDNNGGHKRYLTYLLEYLEENEGPNKVWEEIKDVIVKSLITVQPSLSHAYRACRPHDIENSHCFQILGFDIMLDKKLKPWLLEVNQSPSFGTDSDFDYDLKLSLISDTIKILGLSPARKGKYKRMKQKELDERKMGVQTSTIKKFKETERSKALTRRLKHEENNIGKYELIYPAENKELEAKYSKYSSEAVKIWEKFTGSYKPPIKITTPSMKKKLSKDVASTTSTIKTSKTSSTKLSVGRQTHSREYSSNMKARKLKKMPSDNICAKNEDSHTSSLDHLVSKYTGMAESFKLPSTSKNSV
mmetsp:Transcript_25004/g.28705  ORF Transcript_25004/g.28705 Transcript_25004/m.28705 type:complete len:375 (+) Transcript_25004:694-1818(+)